ncbi:MAG: metal ABC transporter ATP-binding protein [Pseudomonadota bacterium]
MTALIELSGIQYRQQHRWILKDINLKIAAGEIISIIGPNGAGKSTLASILLGLVKPTQGQIHRHRNFNIGYVPQHLILAPSVPLPVWQFVALSLTDSLRTGVAWKTGLLQRWQQCFSKSHRQKIFQHVEKLLISVGAEHVIQQDFQDLSGGERQRVLMARALANSPQLLVLDEPVQEVDIGGQSDLYRLVNKLHKDLGCAIVMISHDLHYVMSGTNNVICLNQHICCSGSPQHIADNPAFKNLFKVNEGFLPIMLYQHAHDHAHDLHGHITHDANCAHHVSSEESDVPTLNHLKI